MFAASSVLAKLDLSGILSGKQPLDASTLDSLYTHFLTKYRNPAIESKLA